MIIFRHSVHLPFANPCIHFVSTAATAALDRTSPAAAADQAQVKLSLWIHSVQLGFVGSSPETRNIYVHIEVVTISRYSPQLRAASYISSKARRLVSFLCYVAQIDPKPQKLCPVIAHSADPTLRVLPLPFAQHRCSNSLWSGKAAFHY